MQQALATRPDMAAAEWAVASAERRARLAHWQWLRLDFVVDGNSRGTKGGEAGPGLRVDLPLFNRNQGGILRAEAEWEQAKRNRDVIRNQIVQEVRTAAVQLKQSQANLEILEKRVVPALEKSVQISKRGFASGGVNYLMVLQTTSQYLDARSRALDQTAALRRAYAELERAAGRKLRFPPAAPEPPPSESIATPPGVKGAGE